MTLTEFRRRVQDAFGPAMEHATPANVREFLDRLAHERWQEEKASRAGDGGGDEEDRIEIAPGGPTSYEEILRRFFADALRAGPDDALIQLWLFALDLAYAGVEEHVGTQIGSLFDDTETDMTPDDHD